MRLPFIFLLFLFMLSSTAIHAGTLFNIQTVTASGEKRQGSIYAQNGKLSIDSVQPGSAMTLIYHSEPELVILIDHIKKSYFSVPAKEALQLAQKVKAAQSTIQALMRYLPAEQVATMKDALKKQGIPDLDTELPSIKIMRLKEGQKLQGKNTDRYHIFENDTVANRLWILNWKELPDADNLKSTLLSASNLMRSIASELPSIAGQYQSALLSLEKMDGMPVQFERLAVNNQQGFVSRVKEITVSDIPASTFSPPKDYRQRALPKLPF